MTTYGDLAVISEVERLSAENASLTAALAHARALLTEAAETAQADTVTRILEWLG